MFKPLSGIANSKASQARTSAARKAIELCKEFDELGTQAVAAFGANDGYLGELLIKRDEVLASLTDHLVALRLDPPTADSALMAGAERAVDRADALIVSVRDALSASQAATNALTARIANRSEELREEIAAVNRAGNAGHAYGSHVHSSQLDSRR